MAIGKNDTHARDAVGEEAYNGIPKSVFATLAYRLADRIGCGDNDREPALALMREELEALGFNDIIPSEQVARAIKILR